MKLRALRTVLLAALTLGMAVAVSGYAGGGSKGGARDKSAIDLNSPTEAPHHVAADTCGPAPKGLGPGWLPNGDSSWVLTNAQKQGITGQSAKQTPVLKVLAAACYVPAIVSGDNCSNCEWGVKFCPRQLPLRNCSGAPDALPNVTMALQGKPKGSDFRFDVYPISISARSYSCEADQRRLTPSALRALPGYAPYAKTEGWHIIVVKGVPFRCWGPVYPPPEPQRTRPHRPQPSYPNPQRPADPLPAPPRSTNPDA